MLHYFLKRLLGLLPTLFLVAVIVFLFVHMLPGDPARLAAGPEPRLVVLFPNEPARDRKILIAFRRKVPYDGGW